MYHRIVAAPRDPFRLTVHPDRFADHLAVLADRASVVPLESVCEAGRGRRVAITFDDGYRDNLDAAAPALAARAMPGTVFVATRIFDDPQPFWWDAVEHLVLDAEPDARDVLELDLGRAYRFDVRGADARARALQVLSRVLRPVADSVRRRALVDIGAQMGTRARPCDCHALLDRQGVKALAEVPGMSLGAHTVHHLRMSALDPSTQRDELERSRSDLHTVGADVRTAAYPFGGHDDWDETSARAAADCGFDLAVTAIGGDVTPRTPRHRIPRHAVRDWDGVEFARRLDRWFDGVELVS
jgi:peptidoglycan/xylan/chitin deacetylase (PgdA/CDA1 family)